MQTVTNNGTISFLIHIRDENGDYYDPDSISSYIVRFVNEILHGPVEDGEEGLARLSIGLYAYAFKVGPFIQPAVYTFKTVSVKDGETRYDYEYFQVIEPQIEKSNLLDPPRLYGKIKEIFDYTNLGQGLTDHICVIGHSDGLNINEPIYITNMKEAIRMMQADPDSPLLRAVLELYNAGAKDISIVAAAPMNEYLPKLEDRQTIFEEFGNKTFYEKYYERLTDTYSVLKEYDEYDIVVPVEAPFYFAGENVDFLTQLVNYCGDTFSEVGQPVIGIMGTRVQEFNSSDVEAMLEDTRLDEIGSVGKFVLLLAGECNYYHQQLPIAYSASAATAVAARLAISNYNYGATYQPLDSVVGLSTPDLTKDQIKLLSNKRINPVIRSIRGKRGSKFEVVLATDNTLSPEGSDYWSVATMRLIAKIIRQVRVLGNRKIGTIGFAQLKNEIDDFLRSLVAVKFIKDYNFIMRKSTTDIHSALVEISVTPYSQIREVTFQTVVGSNA